MKNILKLTLVHFIFIIGFTNSNKLHSQSEVCSETIITQYIKPDFTTNPLYNYVRFGDPNIFFGGIMHNISDINYGDGDDFTIFTYDNRDIVLRPTGSGETFIYSEPSSPIALNLRERNANGGARIRFKVEANDHHWDLYGRNVDGSGDNEFNIYHSDVGNILSINAVNAATTSREGRVGINNVTSPSYVLECNGSAGKPGGGSWSNSSDRRLKTNIKDFSKGLDLITEVRPISFEYNGKDNLPTNEEYVGVIAQELQKIASFMVSEYQGEDGETYLAVDPSAFDFILVNAVKELNDKIDQLETKNENLSAKLDQVLLEGKLSKKGK